MNSKDSRERRERRIALYESEETDAKVCVDQAANAQPPDWQTRLNAFPDAWLFDSEKLLRELDRCRELMLMVPANGDSHATHFAVSIAVDAIWNLRQHLRHLLHLHREGQRAFAQRAPIQAKSTVTQRSTPAVRRARI